MELPKPAKPHKTYIPASQSPVLLLTVLASSIFVSETLVMLLLSVAPPLSVIGEALVDSLLLIALLFPTLYFLVFRQAKSRIELLQNENAERKRAEEALLESEKQLRHLSSQLMAAQERERRRVSRELHEESGQVLTALKLQLRSVEKGLREDQRSPREDCERILTHIDEVVENMRRLSQDLSPSVLEHFGLSAALRRLIDDFAKTYPTRVTFEIGEIDHLLSEEAQIIIYRIFEEALANAGKHANATSLSVIIRQQNGKISFLVEDNGNGFDATAGKGFGLAAMDERTKMLGGTLNIWSKERDGTRITFNIPADKEMKRPR